MEKLFKSLTIILVIFCMSFVYGEDLIELVITEVNVELPNIDIYLDINSNESEQVFDLEKLKENINVSINGETTEVLSVSDTIDEPTAYVIGIDISKSLSKIEFNEVKALLKKWLEIISEDDYVSIITFGEEVKLVKEYSNSKEELINIIDSLELTDSKTKLYEGINLAYKYSNITNLSIPRKKAIILLSDGADDYPGAITKEEVIESFSVDSIPIYTIGLYNGGLTKTKQESLDILGQFSRITYGRFYQEKEWVLDDIPANIEEHMNRMFKVQVRSNTSNADGSRNLIYVGYKNGDNQLNQSTEVTFDTNMIDELSPQILRITQLEPNVIEVVFNEKINGYDNPNNFQFKNQTFEIDNIQYFNEDEIKVLIEYKNNLPVGTYEVIIKNIVDVSENNNKMDQLSYSLKCILEPITEDDLGEKSDEVHDTLDSDPLPDWNDDAPLGGMIGEKDNDLIIVVIIFLCVVIFLIIAYKLIKKSKKQRFINDVQNSKAIISRTQSKISTLEKQDMPINDLDNKETALLEDTDTELFEESTVLLGDSANDNESTVLQEYKEKLIISIDGDIIFDDSLEEECLIGRTDSCTIAIDDQKLSRKHIRIFNENGSFYIEDLGSTNGSKLNDHRLEKITELQSNDYVEIGKNVLSIKIIKE